MKEWGSAEGIVGAWSLVATESDLAALVDTLRGEPAVAVDTESNSLYAYHERVCLIQLSIPRADYIVDPLAGLDLSGLGTIFADGAIQKVFHAAEQDLAGLGRDFGFRFANLFDTMWAARILGWRRVGLADLLWEAFGVRTDKRYQRYNWGRRPLEPQALAYARMDVHYLLGLRSLQVEALERADRVEEALEVFGQLARIPAADSPFGPEPFWRMKGIRDLGDQELAVLWELYLWRDRVARERDQPLFKVMGNRTLIELARVRPQTLGELAAVRGVAGQTVRCHGREILAAVARGRQSQAPQPLPRHPPEEQVLERFEALRAWRRRVATGRRVDPDVIVPNAVLWTLAERNPATMRDLERIPGLGPWRCNTWGPDILGVLHPTHCGQTALGEG